MLFGSSSSVYGSAEGESFSENQPVAPLSPYAAFKLAAETYCRMYHALYGLPMICLRLFTVYGPRQARGSTSSHACSSPGSLCRAMAPERASPRYTYIDDVVAGFLAALDSELPWGLINLGSGQPVTLNQLIAELEIVCGRRAVIQALPAPLGEMPHTHADFTRARELLHWEPQTSFREGLTRFVEWYRTHPDA